MGGRLESRALLGCARIGVQGSHVVCRTKRRASSTRLVVASSLWVCTAEVTPHSRPSAWLVLRELDCCLPPLPARFVHSELTPSTRCTVSYITDHDSRHHGMDASWWLVFWPLNCAPDVPQWSTSQQEGRRTRTVTDRRTEDDESSSDERRAAAARPSPPTPHSSCRTSSTLNAAFTHSQLT